MGSSPHILMTYPEPLPGKQARCLQTVYTAHALSALTPVTLVADLRNDIFSFYGITLRDGLKLIHAGRKAGPFVWNRLFFYRTEKIIKKTSPALIVARHPKLAAFLSHRGYNVVYEVHALFQDKHPGDKKIARMEECIAKNAKGLIFTTKGAEERWKGLYGQCKSTVIPNATFYDTSIQKTFSKGTINTIYYVGSAYYPWKGLNTLFEALEILPDINLEFVGDCKPSSLPESVRNRVRLHGHVPNYRAREILKQAEITVLPNSGRDIESRHYTSPLKLFDYMASCTAVIASDLPSIRELVSEEEVLFFRPDDPDSLSRAISRLCHDATLRKDLALRAWNRAERFSWDARAERMKDFFISLM